MAVQYSPLCDTDLSAYLTYCFANGPGAVGAKRIGGGDGGQGCDSGSNDVGGDVGGVVGIAVDTWAKWLDSISRYSAAINRGVYIGGSGGNGQRTIEGLSGNTVGISSSGTSGGIGDVDSAVGFQYAHADSDGLSNGPHESALLSGEAQVGLSGQRCVESGRVAAQNLSAGESVFVRGIDDKVIPRSGKVHGRWYDHKQKKKLRARQLKESGAGTEGVPEWRRKPGSVDVSSEDSRLAEEKRSKEKFELQCSLEKKWAAENELKQFEAERRLRVLKSQDEDTIIRMQRAQVMRTTEKCKVDTERAFKSLLKTGNVSGFPAGGAGSVETVVSDGGVPSLTRSNGESISPDSSASMQEFRKCQKDLLDAEKKNQELGDVLERLALMHPDDYTRALAIATMKTAYTLDSNGEAEYVVDGQLGSDGKIHVDNLNDIYGPNYAHKKYKELRETEGDDLVY